ncbi:unnamed protein product [Sphenostylis stenocarpa]|uniref:Pectinesterase inhibitor domain-containing protein n=1 Tax=Sphenostylis stenocarpa TaxID=92480 RepID=A0AA86S6G9_9FABA|nr:unnamed protein product [Sphenostylis stenocarpa]
MKFSTYLVLFSLFLFQSSNGSNILVSESCMEASKFDPTFSFDFCVAYLSNWQPPSSNLEHYWVNSIQLTKSNATNGLSFIWKLLEDTSIDQHTKHCLKGCFDSYKDMVSELDAAVVAFKAKDLDTAGTKGERILRYPVILFVFLFECSKGSNPLITDSCAKAKKTDKYFDYDFCIAFLEEASSKLRAPPSNVEDLVVLAIKESKSNATNIVSIVSKLLKNNTDPYVKSCLGDCLEFYTDAVSDLDDAVAAVESKHFDAAKRQIESSLDFTDTCEDQFKEGEGVTSPITKENHSFFELGLISIYFIPLIGQHS